MYAAYLLPKRSSLRAATAGFPVRIAQFCESHLDHKMSKLAEIDILLKANPSSTVARQLVEWAASTRNRIARGDMMLGILTPEEVQKIPVAYRAAAQQGDADAWVALALWNSNPQFGKPDLEQTEAALKEAIDAKVASAPLELVKIRWFFKRDATTASEKQEAYRFVSAIVEADPKNAEAICFLALLTQGFRSCVSTAGFLQQRAATLGHAVRCLIICPLRNGRRYR
jgi:hypothetical protein